MNSAVSDASSRQTISGAMRKLFSNGAWVGSMLDFEAALCTAQAQHQIIDAALVEDIVSCCRSSLIDHEQLRIEVERDGDIAGALLNQLRTLVHARQAQAADFVHWGATSQDLLDTAMVLRLRAALDLIEVELERLVTVLAQRAELHRNTPQIGRIGLHHTLPITFGLTVAGWLDGMIRHQQRLRALRSQLLVLQLGGFAGTLEGLGKPALAVAESVAVALGLSLPDLSWHSQRDRFAECATTMGLLTGSIGKMARDMGLLRQTEVGELSAPLGADRVVASKPFPMASDCDLALIAARRVPALVGTLLAGLADIWQEAPGDVASENATLPQIMHLCFAGLQQMRRAVTDMVVEPARMRRNLDLTNGHLFNELIIMALTPKVGRAQAVNVVQQAGVFATRSGKSLREALDAQPEVTVQLSPRELDRLMEITGNSGHAVEFVNRVLQTARQRPGKLTTEPEIAADVSLIDNGNVRLHYQIEGAAGAPYLILSNSLGTSLALWEPQMPTLIEHFRVLRYDARGHGQSGVPDGPYSIAEMGEDVIALMNHLGIGAAHFCGLSMGGLVGMWLAAHHPARVDRLVLSNTAALLGSAEIWDARIDEVRAGGVSAIVPKVVERWFTRDFQKHAVRQINAVREMLLTCPEAGYIASCMAVRDADMRELLPNIQAPTLVIGGKHDKFTAPAQSRLLASRIPSARYIELNAAHLTNWEMSQGFTRQILEFLQPG